MVEFDRPEAYREGRKTGGALGNPTLKPGRFGDPKTGKLGAAVPVADPYNYFTPDRKSAVVVAERLKRLDFRDPLTMRLQQSVRTPRCLGIDHGDF
jgi:hypothetical protein